MKSINFYTRMFASCVLSVVILCSTSNCAWAGNSDAKNSANQTKVTFSGGDGSSIEKAIIIKGVGRDENELRQVETSYIIEHNEGKRIFGRTLEEEGKKFYHKYIIEDKQAKDEEKIIWFDITEFFTRAEAEFKKSKKPKGWPFLKLKVKPEPPAK